MVMKILALSYWPMNAVRLYLGHEYVWRVGDTMRTTFCLKSFTRSSKTFWITSHVTRRGVVTSPAGEYAKIHINSVFDLFMKLFLPYLTSLYSAVVALCEQGCFAQRLRTTLIPATVRSWRCENIFPHSRAHIHFCTSKLHLLAFVSR